MAASTNVLLKVNGVKLPDPSEFEWGLQDISASNSGRTQDTIMHKNRVGQKRTINLTWKGPTRAQCATILQAVNPETFTVEYPDLMSGTQETRTFYVGDRTAPFKVWWDGYEIMEKLSFKLIEV